MEDHKRKKKRGRSKIFRSCFPSFTADERPFSYDKSDRENTKNRRLGNPVWMAGSGRIGKDIMPDANLVNGGFTGGAAAKRCSRRRVVSRLLKAVLFDSLTVKKIHKNSSKSSIASDRIEPILLIENTGKSSDESNACGKESTDMDDSSSCYSTLLSSSSRTTYSSYSTSSSSSTNSTSRCSSHQKTSSTIDSVDFRGPILSNMSTTEKPNRINSRSRSYIDQKDLNRLDSTDSKVLISSNSLPVRKLNSVKMKSGGNNCNIRLCLFLLLSLVVLMVYGRIYSTLCTSAWFYLLPCRRMKRVNSAAKFLDTDTHQYKKIVIMAGLLDRARNPLR